MARRSAGGSVPRRWLRHRIGQDNGASGAVLSDRGHVEDQLMHWRKRLMRRLATDEAGHAHELTFSCFHSFPFLRAERTCQWLADAVNEARRELDFALWAYVFMPVG